MDPHTYVEVVQLLARYCHIVDEKAWGRLGEIFAPDATMTVPDRYDTHRGLDELQELYAEKMAHPVAHHSTSVVVLDCDGAHARVVSKWVTVRSGGQTGTGVYRDDLVHTSEGWRIRARVAIPATV